jgi:hypothetical protein
MLVLLLCCVGVLVYHYCSVLSTLLQVVLGFSGKRGHRTWRRLKVGLLSAALCCEEEQTMAIA